VFEDMKELCRTYCLEDYRKIIQNQTGQENGKFGEVEEGEEEEEEERGKGRKEI
jgi:hypothetical protein